MKDKKLRSKEYNMIQVLWISLNGYFFKYFKNHLFNFFFKIKGLLFVKILIFKH